MRVRNWRIGLLIAAAACISFLPCLQNGFAYDDVWTNAANFRAFDAAKLKWIFSTFYMGHYQPLTWLSLSLDHVLWGENPRGYHLSSLLLHGANAWLVYALALQLIARGLREQGGGDARPSVAVQVGAVFAALLFALHPLRVESVAWVTDRPDLLSTLFLLLSVLAYVHARADSHSLGQTMGSQPERTRQHTPGRRNSCATAEAVGSHGKWFFAAVFFYLLALLSRSMGMMLPFALLVLDWFPLRRFAPGRGGSRLALSVRLAWEKWPFFALALVAGAIAPLAKTASHDILSLSEHGLAGRFAQAFFGLVFYVEKTLVPIGLLPIYELSPPLDLLSPRYLLPIIVVIPVGALLWLLRRRVPALATAALCYVILIAPLLGLVQAGRQEVADRYSYWPTITWALLAGGVLAWFWMRLPYWLSRLPLALACTAALLLCAALTWRQCQVWRSDETLWSYALAHGPPSAVTYFNCGHVAGLQDKPGEVLSYLEKALALRPRWPKARLIYADGLAATGRLEEAARSYRMVLEDEPYNREASAGLARLAGVRRDSE